MCWKGLYLSSLTIHCLHNFFFGRITKLFSGVTYETPFVGKISEGRKLSITSIFCIQTWPECLYILFWSHIWSVLWKMYAKNYLISSAIAQNALFEGWKVSQPFILDSPKVVHGVIVQRVNLPSHHTYAILWGDSLCMISLPLLT